jgi:hypothetical protein
VTFLLVGATALAMVTPLIGALLRRRGGRAAPSAAAAPATSGVTDAPT